jgi:hypothetical protein
MPPASGSATQQELIELAAIRREAIRELYERLGSWRKVGARSALPARTPTRPHASLDFS